MGAVKISLAEKKLLNHIASGGTPTDQVGVALIARFAQKVWADSSVNTIFRRYGLTETELGGLYGLVLESLMPEPWMNVGGPMLVPTQWFMEPQRIDNLLMEAERDAGEGSREQWFEALVEKATELAHATKQIHDETYGKPTVIARPMAKPGAGCAGVVTLLTGALMTLGWVWLA